MRYNAACALLAVLISSGFIQRAVGAYEKALADESHATDGYSMYSPAPSPLPNPPDDEDGGGGGHGDAPAQRAGRGRAHRFCERMIRRRNACPVPKTRNDFRIERYLGRWYEIGSTALFKFEKELGLTCANANYSMLIHHHDYLGAVIAVVNRGRRVLTPLQSASVSHLSSASEGVCASAQGICSTMARRGFFDRSLAELGAAIQYLRDDGTAADRSEVADLGRAYRAVGSLAASVVSEMDRLAGEISLVQELNSNLSQGNGDPHHNADILLDTSHSSNDRMRRLSLRISEVATDATARILRGAELLRSDNMGLAGRLERAVVAVNAELAQVQAHLAQISSLLAGMSGAVFGAAEPPGGIPGPVSEVRGIAFQNPDARGKLQMNEDGRAWPYWILDVERQGRGRGMYDAALVYSCTQPLEGRPREHLFVLSRTAGLSREARTRFRRTAEKYGIYTACENPYVPTVQRGSCGWPWAR